MIRCANGHDSTTDDYCDTCGIRIGGGAAAATTPTGMVTPEVGAGDCPNCGAPRAGDERFCEVCGLDFDTGNLPAPPTAVAASAVAPPVDPAAAGAAPPPPPGIGWTAVVAADRDWWQDNSGAGGVADGVPFPDPVPAERRIVLRQPVSVVGRTSGSSVADVDCGSADTGVSRRHCQVSLRADGSWTVTDLGSTNGTFVGDGGTKLTPQAETPYDPAAGPIKIGAYTVLRLQADADDPPPVP